MKCQKNFRVGKDYMPNSGTMPSVRRSKKPARNKRPSGESPGPPKKPPKKPRDSETGGGDEDHQQRLREIYQRIEDGLNRANLSRQQRDEYRRELSIA
jgi:hypothetical protein